MKMTKVVFSAKYIFNFGLLIQGCMKSKFALNQAYRLGTGADFLL